MSQRLLRSICGFPSKEKAAEEATASKSHILVEFICAFVYLSDCVFVYLCQVYLSICGFPGAERKQRRSS